MTVLGEVDPRYVSYNVEALEVLMAAFGCPTSRSRREARLLRPTRAPAVSPEAIPVPWNFTVADSIRTV